MAWGGMDGISLVLMIILHFDWVVYLSGLVKYFAYWALSSGENWNYLFGSGWVGPLYYGDWSGFSFFLCWYLLSMSAISSGRDD
jgi:hypothetical protein